MPIGMHQDEMGINQLILRKWEDAMTYPIYYVDKSLSISSSETSHSGRGRAPAQEDFFDKGQKFILGDGVIDQAL